MRAVRIVTLLLVGAAATACGGGGGGGSGGAVGGGTTSNPQGIVGTGIAKGRLTRFGSVFVNGVEYETDSGTGYTVNGREGQLDELRIGQVITVHASVPSTGSPHATRIVYDADIKGPVTSVDIAASTFVVLGQTVIVDAGTSFDSSLPNRLAGLAGAFVEISGLRNADGTLVATRIEAESDRASVELEGMVSAFDSSARTFLIGTQRVDYSGATLSDGGPAAGVFVEVEGSIDGSGTLMATRVERESDGLGGADGAKAELEGFVTSYTSASDFVVNGQRVTTTNTTVFEGSGTLGLNAFVEVEGTFNAGGVLVAREVEFRVDDEAELEGTVDSIDAAAGSFVVLGVTVRTNALTRFEDQSSLHVTQFDLSSLRTGDFVEITGSVDTNGTALRATRIERDDPESELEIRGPATGIDAPARTLVILGVTVQADGDAEFRDGNDVRVSAAVFFAAAAGRIVEAEGTWNGTVFVAERMEIED